MAQTLRTPGYVVDGAQTPSALNAMKLGYQLRKYYIAVEYDGFSEVDLPVFRLAEVMLNLAEAKAELGTITQDDLDLTINAIRKRAGVAGTLTLTPKEDSWLKGCYPNLAKVAPANINLILEIRRERTVELVMEGRRYADIMRWKEGKVFEEEFLGMYFAADGNYDLNSDGVVDFHIKTANGTSVLPSASGSTYNGESGFLTVHRNDVMQRTWIEERDYFYPIPTKERVLTNGVLTQNPGWNDGLGL